MWPFRPSDGETQTQSKVSCVSSERVVLAESREYPHQSIRHTYRVDALFACPSKITFLSAGASCPTLLRCSFDGC